MDSEQTPFNHCYECGELFELGDRLIKLYRAHEISPFFGLAGKWVGVGSRDFVSGYAHVECVGTNR